MDFGTVQCFVLHSINLRNWQPLSTSIWCQFAVVSLWQDYHCHIILPIATVGLYGFTTMKMYLNITQGHTWRVTLLRETCQLSRVF